MKKKFILTLIYIIFFINFNLLSKENDKILKIGLLVPLSGSYSELGNSLLYSLQLALEEINDKKVFIVPNAPRDPKFADNPLVTGDPHIRFYAGYPLSAPGGELIGTLCIISDEARTLEAEEVKVLEDLGALVEEEFVRRSLNLGVPKTQN